MTNPQFLERLYPSVGMIAALLLSAPMVMLSVLPFSEPLAYLLGVLVPIGLVVLFFVRAPLISLDQESLRVGRMIVPISVLGEATFFQGEEAKFERGPGLSPGSQRVFRGDIPGVVKVWIEDPSDPTDYLLFSSRKGDQLVGALRANRS